VEIYVVFKTRVGVFYHILNASACAARARSVSSSTLRVLSVDFDKGKEFWAWNFGILLE
jgi:hypothetical protein